MGKTGSATYSSGTFTVNGSGSQLTGSSDQMHFVYQPMSGDGTIVARVVTLGGSTYPQAAIMIRETLNPTAIDAYVDYEGGASHFEYRASTGGAETLNSYTTVSSLPYWLKLVRSSNTFYAYISADGVTWTGVGTGQSITMAQNVYVGLAVCSQDNTKLATGHV